MSTILPDTRKSRLSISRKTSWTASLLLGSQLRSTTQPPPCPALRMGPSVTRSVGECASLPTGDSRSQQHRLAEGCQCPDNVITCPKGHLPTAPCLQFPQRLHFCSRLLSCLKLLPRITITRLIPCLKPYNSHLRHQPPWCPDASSLSEARSSWARAGEVT